MGGMLIVNGKNYADPNLNLQKSMISLVQGFNRENLFFAPNFSNLFNTKSKISLIGQSVYSNTVRGTGHVTLDSLKANGVEMSLLNHSENRVSFDVIEQVVEDSKKGFRVILCAESLKEVKKFSKLDPFMIAYEPPDLIGGDVSVSSSKPKVIGKAVGAYSDLLVGAGVKTVEDIRVSLELGAKGVLVSSGVMKSGDAWGLLNGFLEVLG